MLGYAAWAILAASVALWELACRRSGSERPGLGRVGALVAARLPGRLVLFALWGFAGFHMFARSTLHGG